MEITAKKIFRQAYEQYGNDVFLDGNRLKAFLSDLLAEYPAERKRISIAINENIVEYAINDGNCGRANVYIDMLQSTYGFSNDIASDVVEAIYYAIYGIQLHRDSDVEKENRIFNRGDTSKEKTNSDAKSNKFIPEFRSCDESTDKCAKKYQALNLAGSVIASRYELIDIIQKKRSSVIYKARCKILNRFVCVEVLKEHIAEDKEKVREYLESAQKAAILCNANILSIYDCGEEQGIPYVVKEYFGMQTIRDYCDRRTLNSKSIVVIEFKNILKQLISGLQYAYESKGILHGGLQPENILINSQGLLKISFNNDPGASIFGTVEYMSPELAKGQKSSVQSDIYSLGCVMMRVLTGEPPFSGESPVTIACRHIEDDLPLGKLFNEFIPVKISEMVQKMLQKNPFDRYNSYGEIIEDLLEI